MKTKPLFRYALEYAIYSFVFFWTVVGVEGSLATDALQYSVGGEVRGGSTDFKSNSKIHQPSSFGHQPEKLRGRFRQPFRKSNFRHLRECVNRKAIFFKISPSRPTNSGAALQQPNLLRKNSRQVRIFSIYFFPL